MITPLPSLDRTSSTFKAQVDTFFASQLPQFSTEAEAARVQIEAAEISATASRSAASSSAAAALASEQAAAAYSNAARWVSGANYAVGVVTWSPVTNLVYRCTVPINGSTVDPSADTDHWSPPILQPVSAGGTGATTAQGARTNLGAAASAGRSNWASVAGVSLQVAGYLGWANFGNGHVLFDASKGLAPDGSAVNASNSTVPWSVNFPTLMGWNGVSTYGVRVDSARLADLAAALNPALNYAVNNRIGFNANGIGAGYIQSDDAGWGMVLRPSKDGTNGTYLFAGVAGGFLASIDNSGRITATSMAATRFYGALSGQADSAVYAVAAQNVVFQTKSAPAGGEAAFSVLKDNRAQLALINNDNYAGLYHGNGGLIAYYDYNAGQIYFNGYLVGNISGSANYANSAGYAGSAGTVNSLSAAQVGAALAGVDVFDIGAHIFAYNLSGDIGPGGLIAGGSLRLADDNGHIAGNVFGGTWKCYGYGLGGHSTLWLRVA